MVYNGWLYQRSRRLSTNVVQIGEGGGGVLACGVLLDQLLLEVNSNWR